MRGADALQDSYRGWKYLTELEEIRFIEQIEALHWIITERLLPPKERGHIRTEDVMIGGDLALNPTLIIPALTKWITGFRNRTPKESHIMFEKIHPFIDGNGRTGRMIYYWQLKLLQDLSMDTIIYDKNKQAYYKWFEASKSDSQILTP